MGERTWQAGAREELQQLELGHLERLGSASLALEAGGQVGHLVEDPVGGRESGEKRLGQVAWVEVFSRCELDVAEPALVLSLAEPESELVAELELELG